MIDIFYFDKSTGTVERGKITELEKIKNKLIWIDITNISKREAELVKKTFNLHPLTVEDLCISRTRIKFEEFPGYLLCVFYGIQRAKKIELVELNFVIGQNFIISSHQKDIKSFTDLKKDKEKLENLFKKGNDFIFHKLLDNEIDNYFPVLEIIDDRVEEIGEKVTKKARPELLKKILRFKRLLVLIKKTTFPQRDVIAYLVKSENRFISRKANPYFRDVYDHFIRVSDLVDNQREGIANTFDVYMSTVSNNMSEVMKVLSIIATTALPLTVISGIYGTNFKILPGSDFQYGFWVMVFIMFLTCMGMIYMFRKRGWF